MIEVHRVTFRVPTVVDLEAYYRSLGVPYRPPKSIQEVQLKIAPLPMKIPKPNTDITPDLDQESEVYVRAKEALKAPPTELLYREKQIGKIEAFLSNRRYQGLKLMNISGVPGVGKRSAVRLCIGRMSLLKPICLVELLAQTYHNLNQLQSLILDNLVVGRSNQPAESQLTRLFNSQRLPNPVVLLLVSADMLEANVLQAFLARYRSWSATGSNLTLVVTSAGVGFSTNLKLECQDMNFQELILPAYHACQLERIVRAKLPKSRRVISEEALKQLSQRITKTSSDVGNLFELCSRLLDAARLNYEEEQKYRPKQAQLVVAEVRHLRLVLEPNWLEGVFACLPKIEQLTLIAISTLSRNQFIRDCSQQLFRMLQAMLREQRLEYAQVNLPTLLQALRAKKLLRRDDCHDPQVLTDSKKLVVGNSTIYICISLPRSLDDPLLDPYLERLSGLNELLV